jgi:hypothetical protein
VQKNDFPEAGVFRSEDLIGQYKTMIKEPQKKTDSAIITSILPRKYVSNCISSRIHYIKRAAAKIAVKAGLQYLDLKNEFRHGSLYSQDGLHLSFGARGSSENCWVGRSPKDQTSNREMDITVGKPHRRTGATRTQAARIKGKQKQ